MWTLLSLIPKNLISRITGFLAYLELPAVVAQPLLRWFVAKYEIDLNEVEKPLTEYRSIGAFFIRKLCSGSRPIGEGFVSPVDGILRDVQSVTGGKVLQVKNIPYQIDDLLGEVGAAQLYEGGSVWNFYLSPRDYHRVHMPIDGMVTRLKYIPGTVWPVNDWAINRVPSLFARNERLRFDLETELGRVVLVMVGALNVGRITTVCEEIDTRKLSTPTTRDYPEKPLQLEKGAPLGIFHLGSSVIVLFEKDGILLPGQEAWPRSVKMGESLVPTQVVS